MAQVRCPLPAASLYVIFLLFASFHYMCDGTISFASYYGDHMVLQKSPERAVLWGYGPEGDEVTVFLSGPKLQKTLPVTVKGGVWRVDLEPMEAGGPYNVTATVKSSAATLMDVLFGDVWLCGGQSNMYLKVSQIFNASEELAMAEKYPHVRSFMASLNMSETELIDLMEVELPWSGPEKSHLSEFSAVCWLFGRYMYDKLQYPVGLVESCWGGTPVEAWSSPRALKRCQLEAPDMRPDPIWGLNAWDPRPRNRNSVLWNAMIHPLLNMTLKGALWYQGEANALYHRDQYNCSFPAMIDDWRAAFHQGSGGQTAADFPFGFVQLSTYKKGSVDDGFPSIRWHQTADYGFVPNTRMPRTFMAVALDLPDEKSPLGTIHPRDKQDVAYRLTLGARTVAYHEKDVPFQGPFPKHIMSTRAYVSVSYDQVVSVSPSKGIFEVCCSPVGTPCGTESVWLPAPIVHSDKTRVDLSASFCMSPKEVVGLRYAWRDWPCNFKACPVYSANRVLPAPPFIVYRNGSTENIWKKTLNIPLW